jgi:hypothetical protein
MRSEARGGGSSAGTVVLDGASMEQTNSRAKDLDMKPNSSLNAAREKVE